MNPEPLSRSIDALLRGCPGIGMPPVPRGEEAAAVTFLGLSFPLNGAPPAAKIYFAPSDGNPPLPAGTPDALRKSMESAIRSREGEAWRLHDASVERARSGEVVGRLLWALRSADRADAERWPRLVSGLLEALGHPRLAEPLLRLNARLREILRAELAPLCQLGGFLAPDGSLSRIKANFDADVSLSSEATEYNRGRAEAATRFLLGKSGPDDAGAARMLARLGAAMQGACQFHSWGLHAANDRLESLKVYVRDERPAEVAFPAILKAFSPNMSGVTPDSRHRPDALLLPFGWRYHGFYAEAAAASFQTIKFYFLAPVPQRSNNDAPSNHTPENRTTNTPESGRGLNGALWNT